MLIEGGSREFTRLLSLLIKFTVFWFEYGMIYRPTCEYPSWGGEIEDPFFGGQRSGKCPLGGLYRVEIL